jgi:hypothetical protein
MNTDSYLRSQKGTYADSDDTGYGALERIKKDKNDKVKQNKTKLLRVYR